jgi:hypothetical protein
MARARFEFGYLGELVYFEMNLGHESGNLVGSLDTKNQREKNSRNCPFKCELLEMCYFHIF